jgi:hypothetical protein
MEPAIFEPFQVPRSNEFMPAVAVMLAGGLYLALTLTRQISAALTQLRKKLNRWVRRSYPT